jgi:RNA polymerase sigma-54 factor
MALSARLVMRQGQSLVMTPQLLQAIKLLQFSNVELSAFVEEELERNPLLERAEEPADGQRSEPSSTDSSPDLSSETQMSDEGFDRGDGDADFSSTEAVEGDWAREEFATDRASLEGSLGTEVENAFEVDRTEAASSSPEESFISDGLSATSWTGSPGSSFEDGENNSLESYVSSQISLRDHLAEQLAIACTDPVERMIGHAIIDAIDESGYLTDTIEDLADRLGAPLKRANHVLATIQRFDPNGVGARNLAECLSIQLRELDRFDPAMEALVANLPLLAKRDFASLRKLCGVDDEDISDMLAEIRRLNPKPGRAFGFESIQPVVADVTVRAAPDGSWRVELNAESLPKLLVNQTYATIVHRGAGAAADKSFVSNCLQTANWLTKSLEQRAKTILKVSTEIVRQQDAFFARGVEHLRPLNLRTIADAIGMHESTVSRVTSNKYLASPRGLFELKYFFTASIPAHSGAEAHSAEAVRYRIKQLIERESANDVLSDDAIVTKLKAANIVIARRTVAKYRESLRISSSVERRREKMALQPA